MSKSILLCDDHAMVLQTLNDFLDAHLPEVNITSTENFKTFIDFLKSEKAFDLILVDFHMPGMDGIESVKKLINNSRNIPVAILSGVANTHEILEFIQLGAAGFVPKTHTGTELIHAIELMLSGEHYIPSSVTLSDDPPQKVSTNDVHLTQREENVLKQLYLGYSNKEIARLLCIEEITVKVYVSRLCKKFSAKNRTSVVVKALEKGILNNRGQIT
ncbi:MAG: response regulator transcription factor [Methylococcales bacterium]|nr:response regulator transcription factor [Methylococcales bacterium]